jgi:hypothetical protein
VALNVPDDGATPQDVPYLDAQDASYAGPQDAGYVRPPDAS